MKLFQIIHGFHDFSTQFSWNSLASGGRPHRTPYKCIFLNVLNFIPYFRQNLDKIFKNLLKKQQNFLGTFINYIFSMFFTIFFENISGVRGLRPRNPPPGDPLTSHPLVDLASPPKEFLPALTISNNNSFLNPSIQNEKTFPFINNFIITQVNICLKYHWEK